MLKRPPTDREPTAQTRDPYEGVDSMSPDPGPHAAPDDFQSSIGASGRSRSAPFARAPDAPDAPDSVLIQLIDEGERDPHSIGLLLCGSTAFGTARSDSTYDLIWIVDDHSARLRSARGTLLEHRLRDDSPTIEITYEAVERLRWLARHGRPSDQAYTSARVLLDKSGELTLLTGAIAARLGALARERVAKEYDSYLDGFAQSLRSWSLGDDLGARAHAAQSGLHLIRAIFGLEERVAPDPDQWSARLVEVEDVQGWPPGFLSRALVRLLYAPDPPFQQMLERRVSRVMASRGIRYRWRHDLQRLRVLRYDEL
jgi:hypothetical protein